MGPAGDQDAAPPPGGGPTAAVPASPTIETQPTVSAGAAVPAPPTIETQPTVSAGYESDQVLRFRASERQLHWAIAVPFMLCFATGAALLLVYNPNPARPYRAVISWIHRLSGLCLFALPTWTMIRHRADWALFWGNIREAWSWTLADVQWLLLMGPSTLNPKISLPHQGKFNAAEKINFMVLTATWPMYLATGVLIWLPGVAYLSWLVHLSMAAAAMPLIAGHIFMATVNPDTRVGLSGMISGFVDRRWARHHYRRWYDEHFPEAAASPAPDAPRGEPSPWPPAEAVPARARSLEEDALPACD